MSSEIGTKESHLSGKLLVKFINDNGETVNPELDEAKYLSIGYVFGGTWENGLKCTPPSVMDDYFQSLCNIQYKTINE